MKTIILDTNFCMIPFQFKVDVMQEIGRVCLFPHRVAVLDQTAVELQNVVKNQGGTNLRAAKFALSFIQKNNLEIIETPQNKDVDGLLLDMNPFDRVVGTQDQELKRKLKDIGFELLVMRNKSYLELI